MELNYARKNVSWVVNFKGGPHPSKKRKERFIERR